MSADSWKRTPQGMLEDFKEQIEELQRRLALAPVPPAPVPAGATMGYAGTGAPTGYLLQNGASLLRADYPALFAAIGTTYGAVDGTHFTLPTASGIIKT